MSSYTRDPGSHTGDAAIDIIELERQRGVEPLPLTALSKAQFYDSLPVSASDRTIRILELESSSESPAAGFQLIGRLRVISLKDSPQISALSYVWGPLSEPHPDVLRIRLDNGGYIDLNITTNCASALKDLTSVFGSLSIWVDAISINQDDDAEKASQILLMEEIYTWAKVYVWLGPRNDASARTFQRYHTLSESRKTKHWLDLIALASAPTPGMRNKAKYKLIHEVIQKRMTVKQSSARIPPIITMTILLFQRIIWPITEFLFIIQRGLSLGSRKLSRYILPCARPEIVPTPRMAISSLAGQRYELDDVLSRPWFHRGWTFQEILLPMDVVIVCGTDFLSWDFFIRGVQYDISDKNSDVSERSAAVTNFLHLLSIWLLRSPTWTVTFYLIELGSFCFFIIWSNAFIIAIFLWAYWNNGSGSYLGSTIAKFVMWVSKPIAILPVEPLLGKFGVRRHLFTPLERDFDTTVEYTKPVHGIIDALQTRQTSDPKDRAFANYAIFASLGVKSSEPDYKKELGLIYQECFVSLLRWEPGILNLITWIGATPLRGSVSWVPHWHAAASTAWIGIPGIHDNVAGKISVEVSSDQPACLVVSGQPFGRIQHCSGPFASMQFDNKASASLSSMDWSQWTESTKEHFLVSSFKLANWINFIRYNATYEDPIPSIVEHVLCLQYTYNPDHFVLPRRVNHMEKTAFRIWHNRMLRVSDSALESAKSRGPRPLSNTEFHRNILPPQEQGSNDNQKVREQILMINELFAGKRSLLVTNDGHVGCGTETTQCDDHLFWICGVSVPMILRPRSGANADTEYTVVGPAFLYKPPDRSGPKQRIHLY
ncbi:heterokaryon incompatibility protein-domain-containing protein [Xylaria scruposa]|nr:heterokaryon incompatibility protein-domain-containing protein [Xylaria scruposa]